MVKNDGRNSVPTASTTSRPLVMVMDCHEKSMNENAEDLPTQTAFPSKPEMHILSLPDPSFSSESPKSNCINDSMERQYLSVRGNKIYELTALTLNKGQSYGSYFVGSQVISDGLDLYVISQVDPLFWILHYCTNNNEEAFSYQPLEQWWQSFNIPIVIQKAVCPQQLANVCNVTKLPSYDEQEDQEVYKFHPDKALKWLMRKYERVVETVQKREIAKISKEDQLAESKNENNGAKCDSFNLLGHSDDENEDDKTQSPDANDSIRNKDITSLSSEQERMVRISALQILSEYLSKEWRQKLINKVDQEIKTSTSSKFDISIEDVLEPKKNKKTKQMTATNVSNLYENSKKRLLDNNTTHQSPDDLMTMYTMGGNSENPTENIEKDKKKTPTSAGVKRLAKVNTKGMKSLTSFFGIKKQKK